ncbi:PREDICTED: uncharacterized protein LOC104804546 [Tarenaya hassleriana]|uniref:uncharacterized protein LOC104804546 n=1 Tax=Tarenaya hassleriana TaxID=28532 RepID=UPI00053C0B9A|nr:PREDICTED: uncharacterized protein LOC104804546 [Tarenaya hassleriana]
MSQKFLIIKEIFWNLSKVVLKNAPGNSQMVSPKIQKDIVQCFAEQITQDIIQEIGHDVFGLLVDESSDVSDKEQMAVVFRFVDKNGIVKERFIDLVHVKETSALSLKSAIDSLFAKHGLSLKKVRGQGYDGAIGASCKRKDMIRESHRTKVNEEINSGEINTGKGLNQDITLQRPGNTRWGSHYKTLLRLTGLFSSVIDLQELNDRFDEINSELLICMASLSPADSFREFNMPNLVKLAEFYPDDFSFLEKVSLRHELSIYIDNLTKDDRFSNLTNLGDLAHLMVETKKHLSYPLVYKLLKLALILPVATATVERCFSGMKFVKTALRNRIGDQFLSNCLVCFIEKDIFQTITNEILMDKFQKMKNRRIQL